MNDCAGTLVSIYRTYKNYASKEAFSLIDTNTQQVLLNVAVETDQENNKDREFLVCLSSSKYTILRNSGFSAFLFFKFIAPSYFAVVYISAHIFS